LFDALFRAPQLVKLLPLANYLIQLIVAHGNSGVSGPGLLAAIDRSRLSDESSEIWSASGVPNNRELTRIVNVAKS
jgi:hypothetical protein